jgi:hypothetical protein
MKRCIVGSSKKQVKQTQYFCKKCAMFWVVAH